MTDANKRTEEQNRQEVVLEDLPVDESKQEDVKGGPTFSGWLPGMKGEAPTMS